MGTKIDLERSLFMDQVNELYETGKFELKSGYAPFCKHIFIPNFCNSHASTLEISKENEHLLKSGYLARTEKELPVLSRWFPHDKVEMPVAKFLDLILYSREQIIKENLQMGTTTLDEEPWGIVSIKGQMDDFETPMSPITMMRNALGMDQGGSGVQLDRTKYDESVLYWKTHAIVM